MSHTVTIFLIAVLAALLIAAFICMRRFQLKKSFSRRTMYLLLAGAMAVAMVILLPQSNSASISEPTADSSDSSADHVSSKSVQKAESTPTPTAAASADSTSSFSVTFIDVGQGDASLISCDGEYMLIDGGTVDQSQKMYAILKNRNITHLNDIVCTHPHADHAGGLAGALEYASCDQAYAPVETSDNAAFTKFTDALASRNIPLSVPSVGDSWSLGSATVTVLGPTDVNSAMDVNDMSLVLRIDYGDTSFLFTGDAEQEEQQLLMYNEYDELNVTVLKAAHHGSSNGASYAWVKAVSPEITVISCGTANSYGHPHEETLNLLKVAGSKVYRTDLQGDITVTSDGKTVSASVDHNPDADVWVPGSTTATATPQVDAAVSDGETITSDVQSYVVNRHTLKFHKPDCSSIKKMSAKNRWDYTGTRESLIEQGYEPCKICNP